MQRKLLWVVVVAVMCAATVTVVLVKGFQQNRPAIQKANATNPYALSGPGAIRRGDIEVQVDESSKLFRINVFRNGERVGGGPTGAFSPSVYSRCILMIDQSLRVWFYSGDTGVFLISPSADGSYQWAPLDRTDPVLNEAPPEIAAYL
jgi:hypothetical protein